MALRIHELDHWYQEDLEMVMKPPDEIPIVELPILDLPFGETMRVTNIAGLSQMTFRAKTASTEKCLVSSCGLSKTSKEIFLLRIEI